MKINSIEKCFKIIELLSKNPQGLKLSEISNMLDFATSTTHHILHTLYPTDYISQDPET